MILIVSTGRSEWERLSCRKLPIDHYANCGPAEPKVCHEKSGKISAPVQCQARFNSNFEETFVDILLI